MLACQHCAPPLRFPWDVRDTTSSNYRDNIVSTPPPKSFRQRPRFCIIFPSIRRVSRSSPMSHHPSSFFDHVAHRIAVCVCAASNKSPSGLKLNFPWLDWLSNWEHIMTSWKINWPWSASTTGKKWKIRGPPHREIAAARIYEYILMKTATFQIWNWNNRCFQILRMQSCEFANLQRCTFLTFWH